MSFNVINLVVQLGLKHKWELVESRDFSLDSQWFPLCQWRLWENWLAAEIYALVLVAM